MTDEKPPSMQLLHSSNVSPWSRCTQMGRSVSMQAASISFIRYVWLAYLRAPELTCRIRGALSSLAASVIPWMISILLTLNAPMA